MTLDASQRLYFFEVGIGIWLLAEGLRTCGSEYEKRLLQLTPSDGRIEHLRGDAPARARRSPSVAHGSVGYSLQPAGTLIVRFASETNGAHRTRTTSATTAACDIPMRA